MSDLITLLWSAFRCLSYLVGEGVIACACALVIHWTLYGGGEA